MKEAAYAFGIIGICVGCFVEQAIPHGQASYVDYWMAGFFLGIALLFFLGHRLFAKGPSLCEELDAMAGSNWLDPNHPIHRRTGRPRK
jgi:hypothetical protein